MNVWFRVFAFTWPYRHKFLLSLAFGLVVSFLWSAELLLSFPVVKVFLQEQTLPIYIRKEIESAQTDVTVFQQDVDECQLQLAELPENGTRERVLKRVHLLNQQSRAQGRLKAASSRLWAMTWVETRILPRLPKDQFRLLAVVFGLLLLVTLLKGVVTMLQDTLAGTIGELAVIDMRKALFRRTLQWDPQTVAMGGTAPLMSLLTYDLQALAHGLSELSGRVVREPLKAFACIAAAFWFNWQLTTLSLLFVPIAVWMFRRSGQQLKLATQRVMDSMSHLYKILEETFDNAKLVIACDAAGFQRRKFHRLNRDFYRKAMRIVRIDALCGPAIELLSMVAVLVAILPGAYLVLNGQTSLWGIRLANTNMDFAELALLYALLAGAIDPLRKASRYYTLIKRCTAAAERVFDKIDRPSLISQPKSPQLLSELRTGLLLQRVRFRYASDAENAVFERPPALDDVDLLIPAGQTVAIIGSNGSGKSTLVNLFPRFYDPASGSVQWDNVDLRQVRLRDLRSRIALVPQEAVLFDGTIQDNIRYGRWSATADEIRDAARRAYVSDFTDQFPDGLLTRIGSHGKQLSGGQRQRIALARAMLRDPCLMILDEPTSAVDAHSERLIVQSLKSFIAGRTTLLITHALHREWHELVDQIVVLEQGRVLAMGTHAELLETCPHYAQLSASQSLIAA